ncbi:MAG: OsmC family protein [Gemmatimonadaceae bacterium]
MTADATSSPRPPSRVRVKWAGDHLFDTGRENGPVARFDGDGKAAQTPPDALLGALASCVSVDVVDILAKRRTPVESLEVNVVGERVDTTPRRFHHITLNFSIAGHGIERVHAERAVELAVTKYCSVRDSLRDDIRVDWTLAI